MVHALVIRIGPLFDQAALAQPVDHPLDRRHVHRGQPTEFVLRQGTELVQFDQGGEAGRGDLVWHQAREDARVALVGLAGVVYFSGISSVFFWLLLVGVVVFLLLRFVGMKWYVKRELQKQNIPPEVTQIKLGLQPHALIISMPNSLAGQMLNGMDKSMMTMVRAKPMNADVAWNQITDVKETENFIMITFKVKGQEGSQIVPKRLAAQNFPLNRLRQHLKEANKL